ncbi:hypothetical protein CHL76_09120 [Marinococcus halophilus]|uniref:Uncharacterized protein n=1 Tax=Marinococcus halophilus TaxID=1371 RepID=A0A510Y4R3_MARHA|nr:hypothetical protein [Marinococcus halophilus]OZT80256.1 hypothetical protein CHL76_09120 [Marinococcus halophilus]GEK58314.1 hypothetical protein MHA01_12190 [Marinococcus halophilus]
MKQLIRRIHKAARSYSVVDFGVLKFCLFTIGLWTGILYARRLHAKLRWIQAASLTSLAYVLYTTFRKLCSGEKERNES